MRFLLDTGIMGDFINHRRGVDVRVRAERKNGAIIGTCVPVAGELFLVLRRVEVGTSILLA